jgi:hypothetical protein
MNARYAEFLAKKSIAAPLRGLSEIPKPAEHLFGHQAHCVEFGLAAGSFGCFLDTGLGKTAVELDFAHKTLPHHNGYALMLTPLAVARQIEAEGKRWGYDIRVIREQSEARPGLNVCNYDRLELLEPSAFGAVVLDESSILKSFTGKTTRALIETFASLRWRMAATATPAPNDHVELAQHSEFLGLMARDEMLVRWFINDGSDTKSWRLKRHGVNSFFDWMASWSRMAEHPRDLGFDVAGYDLPPLVVKKHNAEVTLAPAEGELFATTQLSATSMHEVKRQTSEARAELVARIIREGEWEHQKTSNAKIGACITATGTSETATTSESTFAETRKIETNGDADDTVSTKNTERSKKRSHASGQTLSDEKTDAAHSFDASESRSNGTKESSESSAESVQSAESKNRSSDPTTATQPERREDSCVIDAISRSVSSKTTSALLHEPWLIWCDTDYEQTAIEREITKLFGAASFFSIRGSDRIDQKENAIAGWIAGQRPIMLSKPTILGWGLNFQFCSRMIFVGRSFSYELWYQAVRRCWRFGQSRAVEVHIVVAEGEDSIARVIDRKTGDHARMKSAMREAMRRNAGRSAAVRVPYNPTHAGRLPAFLKVAA